MRTIAIAIAAVLAAATPGFAQDAGGGGGGNAGAKEMAPGQKDNGSGAREEGPAKNNDPAADSVKNAPPDKMEKPGEKKADTKADGKDNKADTKSDDKKVESKPDAKDAKTGDGKPDAVKTDAGKTNTANPDATKADAAKSDAAKTDTPKADAAKTDTPKAADTKAAMERKEKLSAVPAEKKAEAKTLFVKHKAEPLRDIGVSISIGTFVPRTVRYYTVPEDIIIIVPAYRSYLYFWSSDTEVVIVDPDTYEIVDIVVVV